MTISVGFKPWETGSRFKAVVGHYGSGKTEFSLNMALRARACGLDAAVVDMDIVNPFFRSAEQGARLAAAGVELIAPPYALSGVDLPVLSADILSVFEKPNRFTVLDVGGDDAGAAALGRFRPQLCALGADLYYVVNRFRPYSRTPRQVLDMMARIEARARLKVTGLINNANLGELTGPEELLAGRELLRAVSEESGVAVLCDCGLESVLARLPGSTPVFPMDRFLTPDWLQ